MWWLCRLDVGETVWVMARPMVPGKVRLSGGNGPESGEILRDEIAVGRGVHRFWGVLIQKSRSNFRGKMGKSRNSGISGVGVV